MLSETTLTRATENSVGLCRFLFSGFSFPQWKGLMMLFPLSCWTGVASRWTLCLSLSVQPGGMGKTFESLSDMAHDVCKPPVKLTSLLRVVYPPSGRQKILRF